MGDSKGTSHVKIFTARTGFLIAVLAMSVLICAALAPGPAGVKDQLRMNASAAASASSVTAVITPLPDEVSNGTWSTLDASSSNDTAGIITNYTWVITYKGVETTSFAKMEPIKFSDLGLYKIILTVTDDKGNSSAAFTAVYSILDSNGNSLPDWWEVKYFKNLNQAAAGDYDHDGYTNLQEYAAGTDPTVKNSRPGLMEELADNWMYLAVIAAAVVVALIILVSRMKRRQKADVKKKIEAALEIERALETDK